MNKKSKKIIFSLCLIFIALAAQNVSAQAPAPVTTKYIFGDPLGKDGIVTSLIPVIAQWLLNIGLPIVVIIIIWSGFKFLTSRGDAAKVGEAKRMLWWAVVGLVIIFIGKGFEALIKSILEI